MNIVQVKKKIKNEVIVQQMDNNDKHIKNLPLSNSICLVKLSGNESSSNITMNI